MIAPNTNITDILLRRIMPNYRSPFQTKMDPISHQSGSKTISVGARRSLYGFTQAGAPPPTQSPEIRRH